MFDINTIYKAENFLNEAELQGFRHFIEHYVWELNGITDDTPTSRTFWIKDLWGDKWGKCLPIEETFKTKIELLFNIKIATERMYLNGQAHGQCGTLHTDILDTQNDDGDDYVTLVYYCNENWNVEYGGFTLVVDANNNKNIIYPEPNSIVLFNSRFPHMGFEPSIHCKTQRVTMAHKFKVIK